MNAQRSLSAALVATAIFCSPAYCVTDWTVFLNHAGPVQVGMSLTQVRAALGDPHARLLANGSEAPLDGCAYLESKRLPDGIEIMLDRGSVVRIDVSKRGFRTPSGATLGSTESQVKRIYRGRIKVETHYYDPRGHYLIYSPPGDMGRQYRMVFETDGEVVTSFRAGTLAAVALVEGCG